MTPTTSPAPEPRSVHSSVASPTSIVRCCSKSYPLAEVVRMASTRRSANSGRSWAWRVARTSSQRRRGDADLAAMKKSRRSLGTSTLFVLTARRQVGRPSLRVSAGSGGQRARLDVWSCAAPKGFGGRKRICRACGAQSRATSSVRTKRGRREKGSKSNTHSIPFPCSREPHIADAA
jgi:hypothetical protein